MERFADGMGSRGASRGRSPVHALGPMPDRNLTWGEIRNHFGNKKGRNLARTAVEQSFLGRFDGLDAAETDADDHADLRRPVRFNLKTAVLGRHRRRCHGVLDKEIHFLDLFRFDKILRAKIWDFAGDPGGKRVANREMG